MLPGFINDISLYKVNSLMRSDTKFSNNIIDHIVPAWRCSCGVGRSIECEANEKCCCRGVIQCIPRDQNCPL